MKIVFSLILIVMVNALKAQDTSFTRTYLCNCEEITKTTHNPVKRELQDYLKKRGISCNNKANGVETYDFVPINQMNTPEVIINKYKAIRLKVKMTVLCDDGRLKIQMSFQEGRSGTETWLNSLTNVGRPFAAEVYENWSSGIKEQICKE